MHARMEPIRQLARSWERWTDSVEALLRERLERRAEVERLTDELREARAALARATQELGVKAQALERLEATHAAVLKESEGLRSSLSALQERHATLLLDRQFAIERVSEALRWLGL